MLQLVGIGVGVVAIVMGVMALTKGEIKLSGSKTLKNGQAKVAGVITIIIGVAVAIFCLVGIPLLMGT